jgi:hypothetical protein
MAIQLLDWGGFCVRTSCGHWGMLFHNTDSPFEAVALVSGLFWPLDNKEDAPCIVCAAHVGWKLLAEHTVCCCFCTAPCDEVQSVSPTQPHGSWIRCSGVSIPPHLVPSYCIQLMEPFTCKVTGWIIIVSALAMSCPEFRIGKLSLNHSLDV